MRCRLCVSSSREDAAARPQRRRAALAAALSVASQSCSAPLLERDGAYACEANETRPTASDDAGDAGQANHPTPMLPRRGSCEALVAGLFRILPCRASLSTSLAKAASVVVVTCIASQRSPSHPSLCRSAYYVPLNHGQSQWPRHAPSMLCIAGRLLGHVLGRVKLAQSVPDDLQLRELRHTPPSPSRPRRSRHGQRHATCITTTRT